jgi:hypothetical protein
LKRQELLEAAPATDLYYEVNIFGTRTGRFVRAERGEVLPHAPDTPAETRSCPHFDG